MPGGLETAALDPTIGRGGLERATGEDPFESAAMRLRAASAMGQPNAIDMFAMRANPHAGELWKQAQPRLEEALENQRVAGERSVDELRHPPINRDIPYLRFAAGMMSPTKTGSFGESLGHGVGELASGLGDVNKSELDFHRRAAETGYGVAKDRTASLEGMYKLGLNADQIDAAMSLMRQRMGNQQLTPAIKEWAIKNGVNLNDPDWQTKLQPGQREDLERFVLLARGTTHMKDANAILDPRHPAFGNAVKILANQKLVGEMMKIAESRHPMSAYQGQDVGVRNEAVNDEFKRLLADRAVGDNASPTTGIGGGVGQPPAAVDLAPRAPMQPQQPAPAAAPGAAPTGEAPALGPSDTGEATHPFDQFMKPIQFQPNRPGQIQSEQNEAAQKSSAEAAEKRASKFIETTVQPGVQAADELRTSSIIAKGLLDKDPKLTGSMKPFLGEFANFLTTLGLAPERAQTFATNQELFRSQAMLQVLAKQLEQKGVQTESDAKRIMQAGIDPSKPADANRFMIRYMEAAADRMQERASFFDRWAKRHGGQMSGSVEGWSAYSKQNPMARVIDGKVHFRHIELPED